MISFLTYIIFENLPVEKEQEIKDWAKAQYNDDCWYFSTGRLKEEYGGSFCVETNYHYNRMRLPLYIYQLYQKFHDQCNMKVEVYSDMNGGCTAEDYYQLDEAILTDEDWAEWLKEYPDEDTINRIFDELWEKFKKRCEETVNHTRGVRTSDRQIAFVNALKAVDNIKKTQGE